MAGGNGGSPFDTSQLRQWKDSDAHTFCDGIRGITVQSQGGPAICEIQFRHFMIKKYDPGCRHMDWYKELARKSKYGFL